MNLYGLILSCVIWWRGGKAGHRHQFLWLLSFVTCSIRSINVFTGRVSDVKRNKHEGGTRKSVSTWLRIKKNPSIINSLQSEVFEESKTCPKVLVNDTWSDFTLEAIELAFLVFSRETNLLTKQFEMHFSVKGSWGVQMVSKTARRCTC